MNEAVVNMSATNDRDQVVAAISRYLCTVLGTATEIEIAQSRDLRDFPEFDSLGVLEALVWLESTFGLTIPDEELIVDHFDSVGKMADYVIARRS
ncbi:MAG TPA: phosphopantetheine-binding protein [Streptosporangiaceae bacterium]|nr:phosphopantetheine-binding protein [Streptosporangiaceae bacterium]